ncbi:E3 ubiquitin-protein ligase AIP2 [Vitis vinifera]|uniref:E3 ubiquitin-protein ligase AIP2 n=1 Tax=Vitis vinifera TaxID=29760 RepID=A0A438CGY3_VITVI|nr:E3 ubiquitin-protein ligase AIP2 [Vitis vinifera]
MAFTGSFCSNPLCSILPSPSVPSTHPWCASVCSSSCGNAQNRSWIWLEVNLDSWMLKAIEVATILRTRYTVPKFWLAGLRQQLNHVENPSEASEIAENMANRGYIFEGHLTVDPKPPRPQWLQWKTMSVSLRCGPYTHFPTPFPTTPSSQFRRTPSEFLVVYVGTDLRRSVIPTRLLNLLIFVALLNKVDEEFRLHSGGG